MIVFACTDYGVTNYVGQRKLDAKARFEVYLRVRILHS